MNGNKMLEDMSLIKMSYIEEATYPAKKKKVFQWSRMSAVAACLCMVIGLGSIAFATGAIDKSLFLTSVSCHGNISEGRNINGYRW